MPNDPKDALAAAPPTQVGLATNSLGVFGTQVSSGQLVAGRFEVRSLAGVGGMGAVYRAVDRKTGESVALKLLSGQNPDAERFQREARVLSELVHPGIVRHVAHGQSEDGSVFLVMEWLEGCDLARRLTSHGLTVRESVTLVTRVAEAVGVAHVRGIVHRDLNPRNLFLVRDSVDDVRVLDFGIAMLGSLATRITMTGSALGTPGYMAPEQAQGSAEVTPRVDVFALGCVLFECLTGRRAFAGRTLMELLAKILVDSVPPVSSLGVRVPPELDEFVAQMLSKRPEQRPADGNVVAEVLSRFAALDDSGARSQGSARASLTIGEQRVVSVILSADPRHFSAELEGESVLDAVSDIVAPFDARVERLANGSLVITLGSDAALRRNRGSATDRVVQAARCALALRQRFPAMPLALGTGRSALTGQWPAGPAIERASAFLKTVPEQRPEQPDSVGGQPIFVDEVTAGLLDGRFEVRGDQRGLMLRGFRDTQEPVRTVLGVATTLVGRNRELLTLEATYQECVEEQLARVVVVTCPPGLGKSRLAQEFLRKLRAGDALPEIWQASGDPLSAGSPFALIARAVRSAAGILDGEAKQVSCQKLRARVARHAPSTEVQRIAEFVGELAGVPFSDDDSPKLRAARQDPVLAGDQMLAAFEDWLDAESAHTPMVLVLEDLHWGDLPTVRFIDSALRQLREKPLMVLALARPEVHDTFPNLWSRRGVVELQLTELSRKACENLIRQVLPQGASEHVVERILDRASGNALWLEELLRAEVEGRGHEALDTLTVLAGARLEALDMEARLVLRAGSIFGRRFARGGVDALVGELGGSFKLDATLESLREREVLVTLSSNRKTLQREFEFRNSLFREAAYAALTDEDRELGHRLAAEFLTREGETDALVLAEHFERGGRPESAVEWYLRAGQQAFEGGDWEGAIRRAARGQACGASREQAGRLCLLQAEACKWLGRNADCQRFALEASERLTLGTSAWCLAVGEAAAASGKLGDLDRCSPLTASLLDVAHTEENVRALTVAASRTITQLVLAGGVQHAARLLERVNLLADSVHADPAVMGWVFEARAVYAGTGRDPSARVLLAASAAESFELAGDRRNACLQRISLGFACIETGSNQEAEQALRAALQDAERLSLSNSVPIARAHLARALARRGELESAQTLLSESVESFDDQGNPRMGGITRCYFADAAVARGDLDAARRAAREAVLLLESFPAFRRSALAMRARVELARGDVAEAWAASEAAVTNLGAYDDLPFGESLVRLVHAETLHANQQQEAARSALTVACARLHARAERIQDPIRRQAFLEGVPEHARTRALASEWGVPDPSAQAPQE